MDVGKDRKEEVMKLSTMAIAIFCLLTTGGYTVSADTKNTIANINGKLLPGLVADEVDTSIMLDTIDADGNQLIVRKGTRKAGTRIGIHIHKYGGHTCVLTGEITDFIEGRDPRKFSAGTCYYMPPNVPMAAANLGIEDAILIDTFIVPPGEPTITILEHNH